ncbi:MAG TPA: MarR family transcriptional regulator [Nocardioides sp.]|nr:MarR family transcriptional regulator [Nocardioides sp.]
MELHPAVLMFIAGRHVETRVVEAVRDAGFDLTLAQAKLAARIGEHGSRLTDLAEQAQITKQSAGFLVDQLERAGLVERVPDPADARARLVRFTERGLQVVSVARTVERQILREWRRHLGPERFAALQEGLTALREITDPYA